MLSAYWIVPCSWVSVLHGIMSGASEANLSLGLAVNVDSMRNILDILREKHADIIPCRRYMWLKSVERRDLHVLREVRSAFRDVIRPHLPQNMQVPPLYRFQPHVPPARDNVRRKRGESLFVGPGCRFVFLAEDIEDIPHRVNIDCESERKIRLACAGPSLAVFGGPEIHKAPVTESTITIPQSSYGAQKHIPEQKLDAAPDGFPGRTMIVGNRTITASIMPRREKFGDCARAA
jgi:hypothetical protein